MYATNSLSINFTPSKEPANCISDCGIPIHHAIGAKIHPAIRSNVTGSPMTGGNIYSSPLFAKLTIVISTRSRAAILRVI